MFDPMNFFYNSAENAKSIIKAFVEEGHQPHITAAFPKGSGQRDFALTDNEHHYHDTTQSMRWEIFVISAHPCMQERYVFQQAMAFPHTVEDFSSSAFTAVGCTMPILLEVAKAQGVTIICDEHGFRLEKRGNSIAT